MTSSKSVSFAAAAALIALSGAAISSPAVAGSAKQVHCYGVNSCKGTSDCKSGNHDCKGQNDCKGQGFKAETAKQCKADGGSLTEK
ncbi:BufA2 family periplasmic bufferin-type metallophore [Sphingomonas morindae]|uniref:Silver efflux pump n=1 Tax=Sphingomonas morindae TaxID=1541170 RepID=A0ABY4X996_9SPHN|nr:hypothetical protein [Sphingomonas morindae]USI73496.1 hypothetical protein LHA26_03165 [Sphingomonas morindae]